MDGTIDGVVQFNIDSQDIITITSRVQDKWIHVTTQASFFDKSRKFKDTYNSLLEAAKAEIAAEERLEEEENNQLESSACPEQDQKAKPSPSSEDQPDSGYVTADAGDEDSNDQALEGDAKTELQNWILNPAIQHVLESKAEDPRSVSHKYSIAEWYLKDVLAFQVKALSEYKIVAQEDDDFNGTEFIRRNILPDTSLPKYLRTLSGVKWYSPHDVEVCESSHDIHHPIHPIIVEIKTSNADEKPDPSRFFFKLATEDSVRAVARELRIIHYLQRQNLINESNKGIRAPQLHGLVSSPSAAKGSQTKITGFLLSLIPQPTKPLTELASSEVDQGTRDYWAQESERMIKVLHKNNIIWGDAKADNFIVDKDNELWIIDFGGSYTEGWVEPELMETVEGDKAAAVKIAEAITDPDDQAGELEDNSSTHQKSQEYHELSTSLKKRKLDDDSQSTRKKRHVAELE